MKTRIFVFLTIANAFLAGISLPDHPGFALCGGILAAFSCIPVRIELGGEW